MATEGNNSDIPELYDNGRNWRLIRLIVGVVVLLIIIGLLVWFFLFRGGEVSAPANTPPISHGAKHDKSINAANNNANEPKGSGASKNHTGGHSQQRNLANTGPGSVVAIFIGAVAAGALAHNLRLRRSATRR